MEMSVAMEVNGERRCADVDSRVLLLDVVRYACGLTGTKLGCGTGDCGACTVIMNGRPVNSCLVYAVECADASVETIEAVAKSPVGRLITEALIETDGVQCGFCTPGIVVTASALLRKEAGETLRDEEIVEALAGNLCRCTGYLSIKQAIRSAADKLAAGRSR